MRSLVLVVGCIALATARPELYKEKEDFQYSRSSTDEGTKSGFYDAQRGNMGGNYEKAHNMDGLAQNQMSGLMRQVHGELGEGANTRTGDVFGSAATRGIYGQGNYDLSNLSGRNFQEGTNFDGTSSLASQSGYGGHSSSSSSHSASGQSSSHRDSGQSSSYRTNGQSSFQNAQYDGFGASQAKSSNLHETNEQGNMNTNYHGGHHIDEGLRYTSDGYDASGRKSSYVHGSDVKNSGYSSGYNTQSGYNRRSEYDQSGYNRRSEYDHNTGNVRYYPMRVVLRPGTTADLPFSAQTIDGNRKAEGIDENSINTGNERTHSGNNDTGKAKHYQSSFSYHKEWERHDTKPIVAPLSIPSINPVSYYEHNSNDNQQLHSDRQSSSLRQNQNADQSVISHQSGASSFGGHQSYSQRDSSGHSKNEYTHKQDSSSYGTNLNNQRSAYTKSLESDADQVKTASSGAPKRYESSYSYHKSWERRGDPYTIYPSSDGQASQRLTDNDYSSHQRESQQYQRSQHYANSHGDDCDEHGHLRKVRSTGKRSNEYMFDKETQQDWDNLGQQTQYAWGNFEDLSQQSQNQWINSEDLGQQVQHTWGNIEDLGQDAQNVVALDTDGQQTQNQWRKLEVLGQHTQTHLDKTERIKDTNPNPRERHLYFQIENQINKHTTEENTKLYAKYMNNLYPKERHLYFEIENQENQHATETDKNLYENQHATESDKNLYKNDQTGINGKRETLEKQSGKSRGYYYWNDDKSPDIKGSVDEQDNSNSKENHKAHRSFLTSSRSNSASSMRNNWDKLDNIENKNKYTPYDISETTKENHKDPLTFDSNNSQPYKYWHETNKEDDEHNPKMDVIPKTKYNVNQFNTIPSVQKVDNNYREEHKTPRSYLIRNRSNTESTLVNIWDQIDNLENQKLTPHHNSEINNKHNQSEYLNLNNSQTYWQRTNKENEPSTTIDVMLENIPSIQKIHVQDSVTENNGTPERKTDIPDDVGRGDIESEYIELPNMPQSTENRSLHININEPPKGFKTPDEIETVSLINQKEKEQENKTMKSILKNVEYHNTGEVTKLNTIKEKGDNKETYLLKSVHPEWAEIGDQFEEYGQQSDNLGQQFDNLEQQSDDQWENFNKNSDNYDQPLEPKATKRSDIANDNYETLGQQVETSWSPENVEITYHTKQELENLGQHMVELINFGKTVDNKHEYSSYNQRYGRNADEVGEEMQVQLKHVTNSDYVAKPDDPFPENTRINKEIEAPLEVVTEKPGFWKSVGNKLSSAKDKVSSWFHQS